MFERLSSANGIASAALYSGLRCSSRSIHPTIYKARVACRELGGKSGGLRYVFEEFQVTELLSIRVALCIYVKAGGVDEPEVRRIILDRIADYSLDDLDWLDYGYQFSST